MRDHATSSNRPQLHRPASGFKVVTAPACIKWANTSKFWSEHLQHLHAVFEALHANNLRVKRSKYEFGTMSVAYLGHVISASGIAMDGDKVGVVAAWPQPRSARGLWGFLGLTGYYRRFIKNFGTVAAPLIQLLRKEGVTPQVLIKCN